MKKPLTQRQQEILDFIQQHFQKECYWPSIRDVQVRFGFASTNAVVGHLRALERKGHLVKMSGRSRAYHLCGRKMKAPNPTKVIPFPETPEDPEMLDIPIYGQIAAGFPDLIETDEAIGRLQIGVRTVGKRLKDPFALKVRGDSMIDAGICDGDLVVVEPGIPRNGDIVAALIDGESTLKRFIRPAGSKPYLKAENPKYPAFYPAAELIVQGIARTVVRNLT